MVTRVGAHGPGTLEEGATKLGDLAERQTVSIQHILICARNQLAAPVSHLPLQHHVSIRLPQSRGTSPEVIGRHGTFRHDLAPGRARNLSLPDICEKGNL